MKAKLRNPKYLYRTPLLNFHPSVLQLDLRVRRGLRDIGKITEVTKRHSTRKRWGWGVEMVEDQTHEIPPSMYRLAHLERGSRSRAELILSGPIWFNLGKLQCKLLLR